MIQVKKKKKNNFTTSSLGSEMCRGIGVPNKRKWFVQSTEKSVGLMRTPRQLRYRPHLLQLPSARETEMINQKSGIILKLQRSSPNTN